MASIIVISDEPALAETLADELPEHEVVSRRIQEAAKRPLPDETVLLVVDGLGDERMLFPESDVPVVTITRPVRLRDVLYTIRESVQAQTATDSEEIKPLGEASYLPRERALCSQDGAVRISLTEKEAQLLVMLLEGNDINTKEQLLKKVWGYHEDVDTHTLETHLSRLRGKLKQLNKDYDIVFSEENGYFLQM